MTRNRSKICLLCLLTLCMTCSGCWDQQEINDLAIIGALGLDLDLEERPMLGIEILNPSALALDAAEGPGGSGESIVAWMMLEPLTSFTQAFEQVSRRLPRVQFLGHINMVIFGRRAAEQGIGPYLDFLVRNDDIRRSIYVSVCDTATGLLQRPFIESLPSLTLDGLARTTANNSMSRTVTLNEFMRRLTEPGIEPIAMHTVGRPTYDVYVAREGTQSIQAIGQEGIIPRPTELDPRVEVMPAVDPRENIQGSGLPQPEQTVFAGLAVFLGELFVGPLDGLEARGFLWATGAVTRTAVAVPHPGNADAQVILHSLDCKTSARPVLGQDGPRMEVEIKTTLRVEESSLPIDLLNKEVQRHLTDSVAEAILSEVQQTLSKLQNEYRSDIYGFGVEFHRRFPRYWRSVVDDWGDIFPTLPVQFTVKPQIRSGGLLMRPAPPR